MFMQKVDVPDKASQELTNEIKVELSLIPNIAPSSSNSGNNVMKCLNMTKERQRNIYI